MDIQEVRRANLRAWVDKNGTPAKEKSYFSQVLNGSSPLGERAARRLETEYRMGVGVLDMANGSTAPVAAPSLPTGFLDADELMHLIALYKEATPKGRRMIMDSAEVSEKRVATRRGKSANDQ